MLENSAEEHELTSIPFSRLPLSNDFMFGEVMRRPEICKLFLEALLKKEIDRIEYIAKQQDISDSYFSHGIRMDVYLKDGKTVYCIEMDTSGRIIIFKRIRYYQSAIDRHNLEKGQHYSLLPESFIIVISTEDLFGYGLAVYERKVTIKDCCQARYDDGSHVYILNSAYTKGNVEKPVLEFLDCIRTNDTDSSAYSSDLMQLVCPAIEEVRQDKSKEASYVIYEARMMDAKLEGKLEGREEGRKEGREEGREEGIQALVKTLQELTNAQDTAIQAVMKRFGLLPQAATEKVMKYWT